MEPGQVVALVGQSGGGKSTIVKLIEHFYELSSGRIMIGTEYNAFIYKTHVYMHSYYIHNYDNCMHACLWSWICVCTCAGGYNVRQLDPIWFRKHVGLVNQEPVLFANTIADNISYGKENATASEVRMYIRI